MCNLVSFNDSQLQLYIRITGGTFKTTNAWDSTRQIRISGAGARALVFFRSLQRRQWYPTPVLLPGKSHERRSLVGCSPWAKSRAGLSDFTLTFHFHALEKEMATHSSVLAWRIPGTE